MPSGGQGNFAGTGGYGGQFPGFGGASAGYTGGYGNPSSVGGGTAGQTYAGQPYANTLNKYNSSLPNYTGSSPQGYQGGKGTAPATSTKTKTPQPAWEQILSPTPPAPVAPVVPAAGTPTNVQSGAFFPGTSVNIPGTPTSQYSGYGSTDNYGQGTALNNINAANAPGFSNLGSHPTTNTGLSTSGPGSGWGGIGTAIGDAVSGFGNMVTGGNRRQFGGPVAPGGQYTVGENGPETLQMRPGGGGRVIPHNPADRRVALANALQGRFGGGGGITGLNRAAPAVNRPAGGPMTHPGRTPRAGPNRMSGWRG